MNNITGWREILGGFIRGDIPQLDEVSATLLYESAPLNDLMYAASLVRERVVPGNNVTYLVDRNINYTNTCTINCQFCSFYRSPGHSEEYTQDLQQISSKISELEALGGSRILMQGGVNPDLELDWYIDLLRELRNRHPSIDLDCFSPIEIEGIAEVCGLSTIDVLMALKSAGLHGLPGGGAELLVDEIRLGVSPKKGSSENWLRVMSEAQSIGLVTSATNVFGFGESRAQRVAHLGKIRDLQARTLSKGLNGFTSYISWPVMLENNSLGKKNSGNAKFELGASPSEYLRHLSISRIFLDNIEHFQASWPTMGMEIAQIALSAGADDIGSTMMEENVVSASGTTKTMATEDELRRAISEAGFVPSKRDSDYNSLEMTGKISNPIHS